MIQSIQKNYRKKLTLNVLDLLISLVILKK